MTNKEIRFACRACGKCCDGPPQLSIREMYNHLDDFVLQASIITQPVKTPQKLGKNRELAQMIADRSLELGSVRLPAEGPWGSGDVLTTLSASVLPYPHKRRCNALGDDGRCSIYERRPNTCRYVPGQHLLPLDKQDIAMDEFKSRMSDNCDWSDDAPVVVQNGRFVIPEVKNAFHAAEEDDRADGRLLTLLLEEDYVLDGGDGGTSFTDLVKQSISTLEVELPVAVFTYFMEGLRENGLLPTGYCVPPVETVARKQIAVCERLIAEYIRRKDRDARPHTEMLRKLIELNKAALEELTAA